ncbi:hypothetical protein T439DRAFT_92810 [Meredithblackwellia eburnea MCA 4105]
MPISANQSPPPSPHSAKLDHAQHNRTVSSEDSKNPFTEFSGLPYDHHLTNFEGTIPILGRSGESQEKEIFSPDVILRPWQRKWLPLWGLVVAVGLQGSLLAASLYVCECHYFSPRWLRQLHRTLDIHSEAEVRYSADLLHLKEDTQSSALSVTLSLETLVSNISM